MAVAAKSGSDRQLGEAPGSCLFERHFSPAELAEVWNLSEDTVRRLFEKEPGVIVFENPAKRDTRRHRTLRIPESVAERLYRRLSISELDKRPRS